MSNHNVSGSQSASLNGSDQLDRFRPEMEAIPAGEVLTPRVDLTTAATVAIGSMSAIEAHRPELVARFGERAGVALDRVVPTALALLAADADSKSIGERDLEAKAALLRARRDTLGGAATALVERGVMKKKSLSGIAGGSSYPALASDILLLVAWFRRHETAIASHSKITSDELSAAELEAQSFLAELGGRDFGSNDPAGQRARAFTLFFRTYDQVTRMLAFLRWREGDADQIAPTIYQRKRARHDETDIPSPLPSTTPVAPGMPGGNPFQS